jgi:hypothetical protein
MTADRGVNRQKSLYLLERLESAHSPLAFTCGLMGVLRPVVQPVSTFMSDSVWHSIRCLNAGIRGSADHASDPATRTRTRIGAEDLENHG